MMGNDSHMLAPGQLHLWSHALAMATRQLWAGCILFALGTGRQSRQLTHLILDKAGAQGEKVSPGEFADPGRNYGPGQQW